MQQTENIIIITSLPLVSFFTNISPKYPECEQYDQPRDQLYAYHCSNAYHCSLRYIELRCALRLEIIQSLCKNFFRVATGEV